MDRVEDVLNVDISELDSVIQPPPQVRAVIDKTAQFVAKNGKSFEERIKDSKDGSTDKFNFLKPFDPFHAYYEFRVAQFEACLREGKV